VAEGFFVLEAFLVEDFGGGVRVAHGRSLSLCQNGEPVSRNNGIGNSIFCVWRDESCRKMGSCFGAFVRAALRLLLACAERFRILGIHFCAHGDPFI